MFGWRRACMALEHGMAWAMNGVAANDHHHEPLITVRQGTSNIVRIDNRTVWSHPMHLHGHAFRVLSVNGKPTRYREWRDTVIVDPNGVIEIAFVADNPGDWMFHWSRAPAIRAHPRPGGVVDQRETEEVSGEKRRRRPVLSP